MTDNHKHVATPQSAFWNAADTRPQGRTGVLERPVSDVKDADRSLKDDGAEFCAGSSPAEAVLRRPRRWGQELGDGGAKIRHEACRPRRRLLHQSDDCCEPVGLRGMPGIRSGRKRDRAVPVVGLLRVGA